MLVQEGESRTVDIDIRLAVLLAAVAGAINAAAFRAVGLFSGNMTGNVSSLSDYAALGNWALAATFLVVVLAFIFGAFTATVLIEAGRRRGIRGVFAYGILAEGICLAGLGLADIFLAAFHNTPLLVVGLSFLMGVQNAATTLISNARVRTTHISGMATDIGIATGLLLNRAIPTAERQNIRARFRLHIMTLLAFLIGGVIGVMSYRVIGGGIFLCCAGILIVIALPFVRNAARGR